ncbi:hypothetical protein IWQ57_003496, partial [Coemansia nantahalensis]
KKIRRRRQKSLFSMTTADEYSLLDSGRIGLAFGPTGAGARPLRPRADTLDLLADGGRDAREPPTLEVITEMLKEEVRQASSLKQALDRVNAETESMSQRVSNLSGSDTMSNALLLALPSSPGSDGPQPPQPRAGKRAKQVQFLVPDDVRFRWLGMFQQPPDDACDGGSGSDGESHGGATLAPALPLRTTSDAGAGAAASPAAGMHQRADQSGPADPAANASAQPANSATRPPAPALAGWLSSAGAHAFLPSEDLADSDAGSQPLTTNSSVEAVYGGTPYETYRPTARHAAKETPRRRDPAKERLAYLLGSESAGSLGGGSSSSSEPALPGASGSGAEAKYATVSGRAGHALATAAPRPDTDEGGRPRPRWPASGVSPFGLDRRDRTPSPFSKPSLATTKVTVSKDPATDPSPRRAAAALLFPQIRSKLDDRFRALESSPLLQRSKSVRAINPEPEPATVDAPQPRRGSSFDESSISSRKGSLTAAIDAAVGTAGTQEADLGGGGEPARDQGPHAVSGGGILRRVTVSSVHRRGHLPHAAPDQHGGSSGGGLLGGTRDFLKHHLRTRTNSNSVNNNNNSSMVDGTPGAKGPATAAAGDRGNRAKGAGSTQQLRPRRRSDAEVKSRGSAPLPQTPPAVPDHPQLHHSPLVSHASGDAMHGNNCGKAVHPFASRTAADRQSEWVAVSPPPSSASVHNGDATRRPNNLLAAAAQRRSHDGSVRARPRPGHPGETRGEEVKPVADLPQNELDQLQACNLEMLRASLDEPPGRPSIGQSSATSSSGSTGSPPLPLQDLHKTRMQHSAGENDSIDYHMRRLKDRKDHKARRSSFMTTIGNMLGRKE